MLKTQIYSISDNLGFVPAKLGASELSYSDAFMYGESLFTSIYVQDSKPWFLADHLNRLLPSLIQFGFSSSEKFKKSLEDLISSFDFEEHSYLRLCFFQIEGELFLSTIIRTIDNPRLIRGLNSVVLRPCYQNNDSRLKWGNYLSQRRDVIHASNLGHDDVLYFDQEKENILELSTSNIFFSDGRKVYTPKTQNNVLAGVYRENFVRKYSKITTKEDIYKSDLRSFKYCWCTNAVRGLRVINKIENITFQPHLPEVVEEFY